MMVAGPLYRGQTPERNPRYRAFIKSFPCVGCGRTWGIDPMHTGPHGLGQKSDDRSCLPGCRKCHDQLHKIGPVRFQEIHGIDFAALIQMFNHFWEKKQEKKAA